MCRRNLFHYDLWVCTELQVFSKSSSRLWFNALKKYKNSNSARRTASQRHIRPSISTAEVTILVREYPENYQKIATSNAIFSRTADRIAAKFCMTI